MGVRAELAVHGPSNCPVASLADERNERVTGVTWTRSDGEVTEEVRVEGGGGEVIGAVRDGGGDGRSAPGDLRPVLDAGDGRIYRFHRAADAGCACEAVESLGVPVADVRAEEGVLVLTLNLEDVETLRDAVADLGAVADRVEVRSLVRADVGVGAGGDPTLVDRDRLTDRQREVLRTAHEMGYFEYPREASAAAVAAELGVGPSTLAEHLAAAQRKLLADLLDD